MIDRRAFLKLVSGVLAASTKTYGFFGSIYAPRKTDEFSMKLTIPTPGLYSIGARAFLDIDSKVTVKVSGKILYRHSSKCVVQDAITFIHKAKAEDTVEVVLSAPHMNPERLKSSFTLYCHAVS